MKNNVVGVLENINGKIVIRVIRAWMFRK